MPISKVYLDDDHNVVAPDQATQAVETETDHQGNLVGERWLRIAAPGSLAADRIAIEEEASRIIAEGRGRRFPGWATILLLIAAFAFLWFILS